MNAQRQLRAAVLKLAAAHPADRRWITSRLPVAQQRRVKAMLGEIDARWGRVLPSLIDALEMAPSTSSSPAVARGEVPPASRNAGIDPVWLALLSTDAQATGRALPFALQMAIDAQPPASPVPAFPLATGLPPAWRELIESSAMEDIRDEAR